MSVLQICIIYHPYVEVSMPPHAISALHGQTSQYGAAIASVCLHSTCSVMHWLCSDQHQACNAVMQIGMAGFGAGLTWAGIVVQWQ